MKVMRATTKQVLEFIENSDDWKLVDEKLQKTFTFSNFAQAFAFMTAVAEYAETNNHHPEWFNLYKMVKVCLLYTSPSPRDKRQSRMPSSA